jgi:hypothetical protein
MSAILRDNNQFKRNLEMTAIKILLDLRRTPEQAKRDCFDFIKGELKRLRDGMVPINELMINVSLTKPLKDYDLTRKSPKLSAALLMLENDKLAQLGPGDRFYMLIRKLENEGKGASISDKAVDVATFIRKDMRVDIQHYINDTVNVVISLMSVFFLEATRARVEQQRTIGGGHLSMDTVKGSKMLRATFRMKNGDFVGERGFKEARNEFFANVIPNQFTLSKSIWNPYHLDGSERENELTETIHACYRDLRSKWNESLDDPISIFSIGDPAMYKQYYAMCKLRALRGHPAYAKKRKGTLLSILSSAKRLKD